MSESPRQIIIRLGHELAEQDGAAHDLWTWLPSYRAAQAAHGDHAGNHRPSAADVMKEAAAYLGHQMAPTPEQIRGEELYQCPCGEHGND